LLSIESPVAEEGRIRRIAEIEDEDVVSTSPPGRNVVASPLCSYEQTFAGKRKSHALLAQFLTMKEAFKKAIPHLVLLIKQIFLFKI